MGTKNNPGDYDCYAKAAEDEPIFTLRANDEFAPILVRLWVEFHQAKYGHFCNHEDHQKEMEALDIANEMQAWKRLSNKPDEKPDEPKIEHASADLDDNQASQKTQPEYCCIKPGCWTIFSELPANHNPDMGFYCEIHADLYGTAGL